MSYIPPNAIVGRGTFASRPTVAKAGQVYLCTDGPLDFYYDGSTWQAFFGGFQMTAVPLVSAFTAYNAGGRTTTWTDSKGGILGSYADGINGRDFRNLVKASPAAPYTFTVHLLPQMAAAQYHVCGITWRLASNGYVSNMLIYCDTTNGLCSMQTNDETANNTTTSPTYTNSATTTVAFQGWQAGAGLWLQLGDDNTNRSYKYSIDGQNFRNLKTAVGRTTHFGSAPDQIGLTVGNGPGANTLGACFFSSYLAA